MNSRFAMAGGDLGPIGPVVMVAAIALLCAVIAAVVLSILRRRSVERRGAMSEDDVRRWREDLISSVGEASQTRGAHIAIKGFWRHTGLSNAQRYVVLKALLSRQVLYQAYSDDRLVSFFQQLSWNVLHFPTSVVRLSDQQWHRLASGAMPGIVANGDVILVSDSPGAGVLSRSSRATQTISAEISPELVAALIDALRRDADSLAGSDHRRERAESLADGLERDSAAGRWTTVKRTVEEVVEFAANGTGVWVATLAILGLS